MEAALFAILGSSVVAALITSVFSLLTARRAQKDARNTFRYTKLYEALIELRALPPIDYRFHSVSESGEIVESREHFAEVIEDATTRHSAVMGMYSRVQPLIAPSLRTEIADLLQREEWIGEQLLAWAHEGKSRPPGVDVVALVGIRAEIEEAVLRAVRAEIERLTGTAKPS